MFSSCFYFSILLLGFLVQQEYQPHKVILSPPVIEELPYQKVERSVSLSKDCLVPDSKQTLKELCELQQKSWESLKSVKGNAWKSFFRNKQSNVVQVRFAASRVPNQKKEFVYYLQKSRKLSEPDVKVDLSGIPPDDLEELFCLTAKISTPEFVIDSMFIRNYREDITDMIAIEKPDKIFHTSIDVWDCQFRYSMPPAKFFSQKIESLRKIGMRTVVKKQGDLVELEIWNDKDKKKDQPYRAWLFDLSKNGSCIHFWFTEGSIDTEFVSLDDYWLPSRVKESWRTKYA